MGKPIQCSTLQEAQDLLRFCLGVGGEVVPGQHFREELANEGLTIEEAWSVLRTGTVFDPPEHDIRTGEWKYKVEGHELGGKWLVITFSFKSISRAYLITVWSVQARHK
jgi:hypothetical protein